MSIHSVIAFLLLYAIWFTSVKGDTNSSDSESVRELPSVVSPSPPNEMLEMLSFEEWRKKIAEKQVVNDSLVTKSTSQTHQSQQPQQAIPAIGQLSPISKRARNFASYECGAKVVDTNPEAESVLRILNEQTDEYMLNPCKAKIWFVIELCETIQPQNIELANFELYSSVPKEFNIQASDHYPTRDWSSLGTFNAADERSLQRFHLQNDGFVKFIKIEMLSHYGSEHFCPLSVVRIFGTSLFEEVERIDNVAQDQNIADDSDSAVNEELIGEDASAQNLFGTARDAVVNIVRKAAQALNGNTIEIRENNINETNSSLLNNIQLESMAIQLYPKISQYLQMCNQSNNLNNTIKSSTMCTYLKCLIGDSLIDSLYKEYLLNSYNVDKLSLYQCKLNLNNISQISLQIEPTISSQVIESNSSTDALLENSKSKLIENISISTSTHVISSEDTKTAQTIAGDSISLEPSIFPIITSESISLETKSEEYSPLSSIKDNNNNWTENINNDNNSAKVEESSKNVTQMETPSLQTGQTINGNSHTISSSVIQSKESVVLRLSNRIKALEVNLSLSSQYLEELSLRYRKQMEEMQRAFNITISKLNDTASRAAERDLKQQESIGLMEGKIQSLNEKMLALLSERENLNWHYIEIHIGLMMIEVIVVIALLFICVYRLSARIGCIQTNQTRNQSIIELNASNSVSPIKRLHPSHKHNVCHIPAKTQKIEGLGDQKVVDSVCNENMVNVQHKIRKKKRKKTGLSGTNISVPQTTSQTTSHHNSDKVIEVNKSLFISKSQSTPVLTNKIFNYQNNSNTGITGNINSNIENNESKNDSSCHSSSSGVSSLSTLSNSKALTLNRSKTLSNQIVFNKSSNYNLLINKKQTEKSSLSFNLKKLLKMDRK